jgi:hypothetical protein
MLAYDEFVDFLANGSTPQSVVDFQLSEKTKAYVDELVRRQKAGPLSPKESAELKHVLSMEHIMRLAKARARQRLEQQR